MIKNRLINGKIGTGRRCKVLSGVPLLKWALKKKGAKIKMASLWNQEAPIVLTSGGLCESAKFQKSKAQN